MAIGLLMADKNDMEKAVQHFSRTLKISPINAQAQKYLGIAKFQQGKLDQAVFHLSKALEIMPDDASLVNELGKVLLKLKKSQ
jgi:Flp pilus assembly protein TadD